MSRGVKHRKASHLGILPQTPSSETIMQMRKKPVISCVVVCLMTTTVVPMLDAFSNAKLETLFQSLQNMNRITYFITALWFEQGCLGHVKGRVLGNAISKFFGKKMRKKLHRYPYWYSASAWIKFRTICCKKTQHDLISAQKACFQ